MVRRIRRCSCLGLILVIAAARLAPAAVAAGGDPDWPCVQRLVPEISGAMIWAGPPLDPVARTWDDDPAVRNLAAELAARRTPIEEADRQVEEFAATLDPEVKDDRLTALFAGVLETINRDRASLISGIKRFARKQQGLGEQIQQANVALRELSGEASTEEQARRMTLQEERDWARRIFDEREDSLVYLCEQPVLLEQRAFALARQIAAHLG